MTPDLPESPLPDSSSSFGCFFFFGFFSFFLPVRLALEPCDAFEPRECADEAPLLALDACERASVRSVWSVSWESCRRTLRPPFFRTLGAAFFRRLRQRAIGWRLPVR